MAETICKTFGKTEEVPAEQFGYAGAVKDAAQKLYGRTPLAFVHTYGCQQNVSDSEKFKGWLDLMGYGFTDAPENADLILFNTCAVREHAESRVFGNVGALKKIKRERPDTVIAVAGCMTQQDGVMAKLKRSYPYVDIVIGTKLRHRFPELLYRRLTGRERVFDNGGGDVIIEGVPVKRDGMYKFWLPIMEGCNNYCTYCIVPYVRGRERSRTPEAVVAEARALVRAGAKEIMLLGQNVNSYGKDAGGTDFAALLREVNAIEGDFRIRFMTSHPKDCNTALLTAMRDCEKVCKCLHLPVQSGSDRILRLMNRHYDTARYMSLIDEARRLMPGIEFTSDIIVGFPGETEEDFKKTVELVEKVRFRALFTFIFSPRAGTPAEKMEDPTTAEEKSRRFAELLRVQDAISAEISESRVGTVTRVLAEEENGGILSGKDESGVDVTFRGGRELIGNFCDVKITAPKGTVTAEIITKDTTED